VTILGHIQACPTRFLAQKTFVILYSKKGGQIKNRSWRGELVTLALKSLLQPSPPLDASLSLDCRLSSIGLNLSAGKSSILCGLDVNPNTLSSTLGSNLLASLGASISHISSSGHIVLGSPIGSQEYATTFAEHKIEEARRVLKLITDLLLDRDSSGASNTGVFSPDEHNILMRYTIRSKVSHLLRTLPPDTASHHFEKLHSEMIDAHLNVSPQFHSVSLESDAQTNPSRFPPLISM
jgi:hypothetical protein